MRQRQRRDSAREWIRSGAAVTVKSYAKRYGVDRYTAYDDLTALGFALPDSARRWAWRPPATPRGHAERGGGQADDEWWVMLDGRLFLVAGRTSGGAPYGMFADEMSPSRCSTNGNGSCRKRSCSDPRRCAPAGTRTPRRPDSGCARRRGTCTPLRARPRRCGHPLTGPPSRFVYDLVV
jgi:hypothetical protein